MEDGGTITLKAYTQEQRVVVMIQDTGPGIPEDLRACIFEPNFSTKSYGSGLGLAITKRIIERFDGSIGVTSQLGKGTTFKVTLPLLVPGT